MIDNKAKTARIQTFDVLKAIAILAVIYTHCLQFMGIGAYWHHPIFKIDIRIPYAPVYGDKRIFCL